MTPQTPTVPGSPKLSLSPFDSAKDWTQGHKCTQQVLYH